ncbi:MAG TPA: hypothetical protein VD948_02830 [Rhodothermales bacterium]|nr:hypothetical protein [Rhodothermales bacterium]
MGRIALLLGFFVLTGAVTAQQLDDQLRTRTFVVPRFVVTTAGTMKANSQGHGGNIVVLDGNGLTHHIRTTSIANPAYAGPLWVAHVDSATTTASSTADNCETMTIVGRGADGQDIREVVTSITETPKETVNSFSFVTRVETTGCDGEAGSEVVLASKGSEIALPTRIRAIGNVEAVCKISSDVRDMPRCSSKSVISSLTFSSRQNSIDLRSAGTDINTGDAVVIRYKTPNW